MNGRSDSDNAIDVDDDSRRDPLLDRDWLAPSNRHTFFNFHDINYIVGYGKGEKHILKDINGSIKDGSMVAIMGPSGAGKTSLLKALSLSITSGRVHGSIELNGEKMTTQLFMDQCFLVEQNDYHWPFLTCRETLKYAAELLVGPGDQSLIVDGIIEKMGLISCQDTKVGNEFYQGLSGGQKKRLSIAIALLKRPKVIMLDEPTSGLDAAAAVAIVKELRTLAQKDKLIIFMTIHQPSTKVYNDFDQLMLLSKGEQAFVGTAKEAPVYFESIGHPMEEMTNPADFFLDLLNADFSSDDSVDGIIQEWKNAKGAPQLNVQPDANPNNESLHNFADTKSKKREMFTLFRRHALMIVRDPFLYVGRCIAIFVTTTIFAMAYWNAHDRVQEQAVNFFNANMWPVAIGSLLAVVAVYILNGEFKSVLREVKNGMIHPHEYIIAKSILVIPTMGLFAVSAISLSGYGILKLQTNNYGVHFILYSVAVYVFECFAEVCSVMYYNPLFGMLTFLGLWFTSFLFAGLYLPVDDIPVVVRWLYYALPDSFAYSAFGYQTVAFEDWETCNPDENTGPVCIDFDAYTGEEKKGELVLDALSKFVFCLSSEDKRLKHICILVGMALAAKFFYALIVLYTCSRATKIRKAPLLQNKPYEMGLLSWA